MGTLQRLAFCGAIFLIAASLLTAGCDSGRQSRPIPAPAPPAPPPPPPTPPSGPPPVSEWKPDPKLLDQLDAYRDLGDYQIRIPKECLPQPISALPTEFASYTKVKIWAGEVRDDGTRLQIVMITAVIPKNDPGFTATAEQELEVFLSKGAKKSNLTDWQQTPIESGQVGGLMFVRTSFQGKNHQGMMVHGICYLTKNAGTSAAVLASDFEPHSKQSLDVAAASFLTLRKK